MSDDVRYEDSCEFSISEMNMVCESKSRINRSSSHRDLRVYRAAFDLAIRIHKLTEAFPPVEKYSLTDQIRRSSRSVAANIAEAWRKKRYRAHFISKLNDAEAEIAETQTWLEFANAFDYLSIQETQEIENLYSSLLGSILGMIQYADEWTLPRSVKPSPRSPTSPKSDS